MKTVSRAVSGSLAILILGSAVAAGAAADAAPAVGVVPDPCAEVFISSHPQPQWVPDWSALDWSQQCRYSAANAALGPAARGGTVFIGDSITEDWLVRDRAFFGPARIDRGISGQTSGQMLVRFRADVLDLEPTVVHIMAGTNDIAGNTGPTSLRRIQANIMSMVELARAHGIRVILASIPPAKRFPWRPDVDAPPAIAAMNAWLRDYAAREHLVYVDYFSTLTDGDGAMKAAYSDDGVHPNAAGFLAMRPLALAALQKAND